MKLPTQPYKGARDFFPGDKRLQNYIFNKWQTVVKKYGYEQYDAPILEPLDIYRAKTGEEILSEQIYNFTDRGGREIAIRPEMTPSVSRMVAARRQELAYPLRWFSIPNLWRYERPQRGRLREHWQLNVDIFGEEGVVAEHEIIELADAIMVEFGAKRTDYLIKINSRVHLDNIFGQLDLSEQSRHDLMKLIDKKDKLEKDKYSTLLVELLGSEPAQRFIHSMQNIKAPARVQQLVDLLGKSGATNVEYDPFLARGFDYYTDIVFEVFDTDPTNNRSMFGGGRYDGLVGLFGVEPVPTVGFGMGDVTLVNFLETHGLLPELKNEIDLHLILLGNVYAESLPVIAQLRRGGLHISVDATDRKIEKKIKSASKNNIENVLIIGENELNNQNFTLKNLKSGEESRCSLDELKNINTHIQ